MLTFLLVGLVGGLIIWLAEERKSLWDFIGGFFAVGTFVGVFAFMIATVIFSETCSREEGNHKQYELVQMNLGNNIKGDFFLGCGSIGQSSDYYAYTKNSNGEISLSSYSIHRTKIVYTKGAPKLESYELVPVNKDIWLWAKPIKTDRYFRFYVPEGSIYNGIDINLK